MDQVVSGSSLKRSRPDSPIDESREFTRSKKVASNGNGSQSSLQAFIQLLDFSKLSDDHEISARFAELATLLLNEFHIALVSPAKGKTFEYELLEIEFYLRKDHIHEDPYTHASVEQSVAGRWYFHRVPKKSDDPSKSATTSSGYRGGTRKGLDITMGTLKSSPYFPTPAATSANKSHPLSDINCRGGILLRSLRRVHDGHVISGPSLLVDEILKQSGESKIADLVETGWGSDISISPLTDVAESAARSSNTSMKLIARTKAPSGSSKSAHQIYTSPRIGLDLSHHGATASPSDSRVKFVSRRYRYFTNPHLLTANGRVQTFLGIYRSLNIPNNDNSQTREKLVKIAGIKRATVDNYISEYLVGRKGDLKVFVGPSGKGVCSSNAKYIRMIAAVEGMIDASSS